MLSITNDPTSLNQKLVFETILDRSMESGQVMRAVLDKLVEELSVELKPEVREAITKNIDQLVKDVGKEIVIAGLRELLRKPKKSSP